jgi:hypothetical protein
MAEDNHSAQERVFHTNGGGRADTDAATCVGARVKGLPARVKKIATTDEGKLQIVLEGEVIRPEELEKIRDLFLIQQGRVFVDFIPEQGELCL